MDFSDRRESGLSNDSDDAESRMRDALGIGPGKTTEHRGPAARPRKQFVRDGQVQVEVLQSRRSPEAMDGLQRRLTALQDELGAERNERIAAQRALGEARAAIQQLQTKLAHNALATAEVLAAEQQTRVALELQLQELTSKVAELPAAEIKDAKSQIAETKAAATRAAGRPKRTASDSDKPGKVQTAASKRAAVKPAKEPKPVKWWLPSYQARKRK